MIVQSLEALHDQLLEDAARSWSVSSMFWAMIYSIMYIYIYIYKYEVQRIGSSFAAFT